MIKIAPSMLTADFTKLGDEIKSVSSADYLHFDVMDGLFVPNISFGTPILESVRRATKMTLDVHLMISKPSRYIEQYATAGADIITFHIESESEDNITNTISMIRKQGKKAGLSLKPKSSALSVIPYIETVDQILVMTVEPGFGGQAFMPEMLPKITELRNIIIKRGLDCDIEVDGGINPDTARLCVKAGANILIAGNDIFKSTDRAERIAMLRVSNHT